MTIRFSQQYRSFTPRYGTIMHRTTPGSGVIQMPSLGGQRYWCIVTAVGGGGGGSTGSYYFAGECRGGGSGGGSGAWARNFMFPTFGGFAAAWEVGAGGAGGIGGTIVHQHGQSGGRTLFHDLEFGGGRGGDFQVGIQVVGVDIMLKDNMYYQGSRNTPGGELRPTVTNSLRMHYINSQRDNIGHGFHGGLGGTKDDQITELAVAGGGPFTRYTSTSPGNPYTGNNSGGGGGGASWWGSGGNAAILAADPGSGYGVGGGGGTLAATATNNGSSGRDGFLIVQWMIDGSFKSNSSGWRK